MNAHCYRIWLALIALSVTLLACTARGEGTPLDDLAARLGGRGFSGPANSCAYGSVQICNWLQQNPLTELPNVLSRGVTASSGAPAVGRSEAEQIASVARWVDRALEKVGSFKSGGGTGAMGLLGAGSLLPKAEGILGTLKSNGGDIKQALSGGGLLDLVTGFLGEAKNVMAGMGLGNGAFLDPLIAEVPALAAKLTSGQTSIDGMFADLTSRFGGEPLIQQISSLNGDVSQIVDPSKVVGKLGL